MSETLVATCGGLAALLGWGFSDWMAARSSKLFSGFETNAAIQTPGIIIGFILLFLTNQHLPSFKIASVIVLTTFFFTAAYLLFIKALSLGAMGVVTPIANSFPAITLLLSVVFLSTIFTHEQIISMAIIIIGTILLAYQNNVKKLPNSIFYKDALLALGAAVSWGIGFFIVNTAVDETSWQVIVGILGLSQGFIAIDFIAGKQKKPY